MIPKEGIKVKFAIIAIPAPIIVEYKKYFVCFTIVKETPTKQAIFENTTPKHKIGK